MSGRIDKSDESQIVSHFVLLLFLLTASFSGGSTVFIRKASVMRTKDALWIFAAASIGICRFRICIDIPLLKNIAALSADKISDQVGLLPGQMFEANFKHYSGYLDASEGNHLHYWQVYSYNYFVCWFVSYGKKKGKIKPKFMLTPYVLIPYCPDDT